jgi:hypothetical protein
MRADWRYYNDIRTHRSLDKDAPVARSVKRTGSITSFPILGRLHHHYARVQVFGTHRRLTEAVAAAPVNPTSDRSRGGGPAGHISLPEPPYLDRQRQQIPRTSTSYSLHGHR